MKAKFSICILVLMVNALTPIFAQGDLFITPRRIIFEAGKTTENVNLANTGKDTAQYTISMLHYTMNPDGSFVEITKEAAGKLSAEPYLRIYPRTVKLAPGESQVVKVQYTKTAGISEGEYRSHLYFRATPKQKPIGLQTAEQTQNIGVSLVPVFGLSIPLFIKEGKTDVDVKLTNIKLTSDADALNNTLALTLNRTGNSSSYGDITLIHQDLQGNKKEVGLVRGIAVYFPNAYRTVKIPLIPDLKIDSHKGKLIIQYKIRECGCEVDGKITETTIDL